MENSALLSRYQMPDRLRSYFNPKRFDPRSFRKTIMLAILAITLGEVTVFVLLRQSARLGELPRYLPDVIIISISFMEFLVGPLLAWLGSQRRRFMMIVWLLLAAVCMLPVLGLPKPEAVADTPLCNVSRAIVPAGISSAAAVRLSMLVLMAIGCALARLAIWAHAQAYLDEHNPSVNVHMHFSIFVLIRVILLLAGPTMIKDMVEKMPWLQVVAIVIKLFITSVQMLKYPRSAPIKRLTNQRGFFRSLGRVFRSKLAVTQILSMSLLSAGLWGFATKEADIVKVKYHAVPGHGILVDQAAFFQTIPIILAVIISGYIFTEPVMAVFNKTRAMGSAALMTALTVIMYIVLTVVLSCSKGDMAGLTEIEYNPPGCGLNCGCDRPWTEFAPVCITEQLATYYSPCHAGCSLADDFSGISYYANCSCAPGGRATAGACGAGSCASAHALHKLLFVMAVLCTVLAFSWQGTVMLESVDGRDKSVAIGVASAFVSLVTFAGAHAFYYGIGVYTCANFEGSTCYLQNSKFPLYVGLSSTTLALTSLAISLSTWILLRRRKNDVIEEIDLSRD